VAEVTEDQSQRETALLGQAAAVAAAVQTDSAEAVVLVV
jgi:hypothetical protein